MSFILRAAAFATMLVVGAVCAFTFSRPHPVDPGLHASVWPLQDWIFWGLGILLVGYGLFNFVRRGGYFDWRLPFWIIVGSAMIYAEWFNVVPMRELACQMLHGHSHVAWGQCYRAGGL